MDMISGVITGAIAGAIFGYTGYIKNKPVSDDSSFDLKVLAPTIILSAIAGGVVGSTGVTVSDESIGLAMTSLSGMGVGLIVQNLLKYIFRKRTTKKK